MTLGPKTHFFFLMGDVKNKFSQQKKWKTIMTMAKPII